MESLIYEGVEFSIGDTVAYTDVAKKQADEEEWVEWGWITAENLNKEHKIIGFTDDLNANGWNNMILDHEEGETAPDHLKLIKKAE